MIKLKYFKKLILSWLVIIFFLFAFVAGANAQSTIPHKLGPIKIGGNADDPAIWIHPTNPSKSLMFLSDKTGLIGAADFTGRVCQTISLGTALNNIDVKKGFNYGGQNIDIVAGNLRSIGKLAVAWINPNHNCNNDVLTVLAGAGSSGNNIQIDSYGFTLYKRSSDGSLFVFDKPKSSTPIRQYRIDGSSGTIQLTQVRTVSDVSIGVAEGFVADDQLGFVYFAEEASGIHKYNADPNSANLNRLAFFASGDGISGDREGFGLYSCNDGTGYLVLSSQGNSQFKVYDRQSNAFLKTFLAQDATGTDGLDVTSSTVIINQTTNTPFPNGFAIIHDDPQMQYYVYDWADIANMGSPSLRICPNGTTGGFTPTPTPRATSTPTPTPRLTATPTPTPLVTSTPTPTPPTGGGTPTDPNYKVAFIGDSGNGTNFTNVLNLIKSEGAQAVVHQGDFDYNYDADGFFAKIDSILGSNFPYFASVGNHDVSSWNEGCSDIDGCYAKFLKDRMARIGVTPDDPNLNDQMYSAVYKGLRMVFVGQNGASTGDGTYAPYINSQLANDNHTWKVCSWHKNQNYMQLGGKGNEMGWNVYENCRIHGAIVASAHEHTYERTKTLTDMDTLTVDTTQHPRDANGVPQNPNSLLVAPGKSFVFVSGLGGNSIRNQDRCLPTTYPYGGGTSCNYIWARAYTSDQGASYGALFITFYVDGNPNKARGYFKNINGQVIDLFEITKSTTAVTPGPTSTSTPTPRPTSVPTPTPRLTATPTPTPLVTSTPTPTPASCLTSGSTWQWQSFPLTQSGIFTTEFDATPHNNNMDGVTGISTNVANAYTDMAAIVRFFTNGLIEARNGGTYQAQVAIPYTLGNTYHFRLVVSTNSHTYDVFVTPPGLSEIQLANDFAFRTEQANANNFNYWNIHRESGSHTVCNFQIGGITSTATPTQAFSPTPTPSLTGDADGDGDVDENDYQILLSNYNQPTSGGPSRGDFNRDGITDGVDYVIWMTTYQLVGSPTPTPRLTATPTPTPRLTSTPTPTPRPTSTPTPTPTSAPLFEIIIDNGQPGYTETVVANPWINSYYAYRYGGSARANYCFYPGDSASWETTLPATGTWEISAWWTSGAGRIRGAQYQVYVNGVLIDTQVKDQQINGGRFNLLGEYQISAGSVAKVVVLDTPAPGFTCNTAGTTNQDTVGADAVRFATSGPVVTPTPGPTSPPVTATPTPPSIQTPTPTIAPAVEVIIDNGQPGYQETVVASAWVNSYYAYRYGGSARANYCFYPGDSASWETTIPATGTWEISAWWTSGAGRIKGAQYQIFINGSLVDTQVKDQQLNGGRFNLLGTYQISAGSVAKVVVLDTPAPGFTCNPAGTTNQDTVGADAVRFAKVQ